MVASIEVSSVVAGSLDLSTVLGSTAIEIEVVASDVEGTEVDKSFIGTVAVM